MRQMGGAYPYSFDISMLLFGVCMNLAGLPYSAGFLGKEFLLFQILRDDFISGLVRGCWLVSFICTPIYMFTVTFFFSFGPRKGNLSAYASYWYANFKSNLQLGACCRGGREAVSSLKEYMLHQLHKKILQYQKSTGKPHPSPSRQYFR
jgi:formate hydrogenlyase subunit 3/multisubunit Na+/H+ antiporter MnhD subunit